MPALGLWRLTRNSYGRRAYEALGRAGVTATRMYEYVGSTADPPETAPPTGVTVGVREPGDLSPSTHADFAALHPDDVAVVATSDDEAVGHLFLSDRAVTVDALETTYDVEGAYVWRVFVAPEHRERGVASALLSRALDRARSRGLETAHALVAADNRPSQWLFEGAGFARRRRITYVRVRRFVYRNETGLGA